MKKLINLRCSVAIGNEEFGDTSIWNHIRYIEMDGSSNSTEYYYGTFAEAHEAIENNMIRNAETGFTLFRNRPTIEIHWGDICRNNTELTEKTFKPIRVRWDKVEVTRLYTMKDLIDLLPADQFCEWLKDQGITQIGSF